MTARPKTARAVHANRGVEAAYRKRMQALIDEMHASVQYWLRAAYRKTPPRMAKLVDQAQDAAPVKSILQQLDELAARWVKRFDEESEPLANLYLQKMFSTSDKAFTQSLKDAGWSVDLKMTPAMRDAFQASLAENVGLIKSIPEQYLQQVQGVVTRSYSAGRDLETMVSDLQELYPQSKRRAELIARDQSNKANAIVNRARTLELGITEAIWMHSSGGKEPRPEHVAANGKRYNIAEGCYIDGEYILPGEKINCRCVSRPVLPF